MDRPPARNVRRFAPVLRLLAAAAAGSALFSGCLSPLDLLGVGSSVSLHKSSDPESTLEDDRIEDKHPVFDASLDVEENFEGCTVTLNKSGSVTRLDIASFDDAEVAVRDALYPDRAGAISAALSLHSASLIPSIEAINGVMKPFNDGLYAAIELGIQDGLETGKRQFLSTVLERLEAARDQAGGAQIPALEDAIVHVAGALLAGGDDVALDETLQARAEQAAGSFGGDPQLSRPIGFYTWNDALSGIFRRDRYLQNLERLGDASIQQFGQFAALAAVIEEDEGLEQAYLQLLALNGGLTNPFASYSAADLFPYVDGLESLNDVEGVRTRFTAAHPGDPYVCSGTYLALLPASTSPDTEFFNGTYCGSAPAEGVSFIDLLIEAIRSGDLDLTPDQRSGWYDYQLYALEMLLVPEHGVEYDNLFLTAAYKQKLIDSFKSLITQTRETHVKQLSVGNGTVSAPPPEIEVSPQLPIEPFPSFYLRTARAYRFLSTYLETVLGAEFMTAQRRLYEDDSSSAKPLGQELEEMTTLLYGLYTVSARSVGVNPEAWLLEDELAAYDRETLIARAQEWLAGWQTDRDVLADPRVIVPVGADDVDTFYWAVIGVKLIKISAEFYEGYEPVIRSLGGCELKGIVPAHYWLPVESMVEVRIRKGVAPLTRDEFRALCDQYETREEIVAALEGL